MDEDIQHSGEKSVEKSGPRCSYCGAVLYPSFYFCLQCATPYKSIETVLSPVYPSDLTESELIKKKAPKVWPVFWTYCVVIFISFLFYHFLFPGEDQFAYALIFGVCSIMITTIALEVIFWKSLAVQLKKFGFFRIEAWIGFVLLAGLLVVNYVYFQFLHLLIDRESVYCDLSKAGLPAISLFLFLCLIPGIVEEIGFRGLVQHWLQIALKPWRAIFLASALFTALHLSVLGAPYIFLVGTLFGWVKWKTGSLYPSMVLHIVHNAVVLFIFPVLRGG